MTEHDPTPLASLTDVPELPGLLESARRRVPDDATVARLAARLGVAPSGHGGAPSQEPGTVPPPTAPLATAAAVKAVAGVALLAGAGIVTWNLLHPGVVPTPSPRSPESAAILAPRPSSAPAEPVEAPQGEPPSAPEVGAPAPTTTVVGSTSVAPDGSGRAQKKSETELVGEARSVLRADPARALRLTAEHRRLYSRGVLADEREVIAIEALAALGRRDEARARARAFEAASPGTPYAQRIERATGGVAAKGEQDLSDPKSAEPSKKEP